MFLLFFLLHGIAVVLNADEIILSLTPHSPFPSFFTYWKHDMHFLRFPGSPGADTNLTTSPLTPGPIIRNNSTPWWEVGKQHTLHSKQLVDVVRFFIIFYWFFSKKKVRLISKTITVLYKCFLWQFYMRKVKACIGKLFLWTSLFVTHQYCRDLSYVWICLAFVIFKWWIF